MNKPESPIESRDPTLLFEEYLRAWDAGDPVNLGDLCARAGPRVADLKKRIEIFRTLQELSDTLDTPSMDDASVPVDIDKIGRFERLVRIGQGGLSQVFLAHDPALKRNVALKILSPDQITTSDARSWIASEAQSLARLDHPGVVRVFEVDEADGFAYVAMEFLAGPSLAAVIERIRSGVAGDDEAVEAAALRLSTVNTRCRLVLRLARALAYCHAQGIVHRDIKPGNILVQANGEPKWIDFGLAHIESDSASLTQVTQRLMGTPAYIAPEQVDGGRTGASPRSDQFSLGVVLYELLTSKNAFLRSSRSATLDAISRAEPPAPRKVDASIPADLERICLHALERSPDARYPSIDKMADDLEAFLEHRPISLRAPTPVQRFALWAQRHRREIALSARALGCALVVAIAVWVVGAVRARSALKAQLGEFDATVAGLDSPQHFVKRYDALRECSSHARTFDSEWIATVLAADLAGATHAAVERTSQRMSEVLAEEWKTIETVQSTDHVSATTRLLHQWEDAIEADANLCPDCTFNKRDRERGMVDLPESFVGDEISVWRHEAGSTPITSKLRAIDAARRRTAGLYRVQTFDSLNCLARETEFLVRAEEERRALTLRPLHTAIASRMVDVGPTKIDIQPASVDVEAYRIMRDPVRWNDLFLTGWSLERVAGLKISAEALSGREIDWNDPAALGWDDALSVASTLGARFPTGGELTAFMSDSRIETPGSDSTIAAEILSSVMSDDSFRALHYDSKVGAPHLQAYPTHNPAFERRRGIFWLFTFRLARSAPD
jgi:predicted Ser/Thr protein kinase